MMKEFLGSGKSDPDKWLVHPKVPNAVYQNIMTGLPKLKHIPEYVTSLSGVSHLWPVLGATSIYNPQVAQFMIILTFAPGAPGTVAITLARVKEWKWEINWVAFGSSERSDLIVEPEQSDRIPPDEFCYV